MKICTRNDSHIAFREAISWITDYRRIVPISTSCGVAYNNVGIQSRTATNIMSKQKSCLLHNFCKVLKMHGLALAYENEQGKLIDIGDGTRLPKDMTQYMHEKLLRSEKNMSFKQIKHQMIKLLDIDKETVFKILNSADISTATVFQFHILLQILYSIDMHIWIYSPSIQDQKYRII